MEKNNIPSLNHCEECGENWDITKFDYCPTCDKTDDLKYGSYSPQIDIDYDAFDHE